MKHFKYIFIPLVALLLSSCGTNATSSDSSFNSEDSSNNVSTTSTSDGDGGSGGGRKLSARNPMNEPKISEQYYLNHIGDIYNTWKSYQGDGVTIAVIDVGFKANHPDFTYEDGSSKVSNKSASFTFNTSSHTVETIVGNSVDNLRNKVTDPYLGYNDDHGTFCAGIAAAGINGKGVMGIAPLADLMLLKTDGYVASVKEAFHYAATNGAKVITISIGSYSDYGGDLRNDGVNNITTAFDTVIEHECYNNNIIVVSAAGNGGIDGDHSRTAKTYPGATPYVIGVGGLKANKSDKVWEGSSYNASSSTSALFCDVFAPSDGMYGCCSYTSDFYDGGYDYVQHHQKWIGTSFAAPIVAGMAALYFEKNPNATSAQFENALFNNSSHIFEPGDGLSQSNIGHGRVDVGALLGTTLKTEIIAKLKNSGAIYAYYWNSVTGANNTWPGQYLGNYDNHIYDLTMDASKYDSVIFNTGNNSSSIQSVDLSISSFIYGNTLDMDQNHELDEYSGQGKAFIGTYLTK